MLDISAAFLYKIGIIHAKTRIKLSSVRIFGRLTSVSCSKLAKNVDFRMRFRMFGALSAEFVA